MKRIRVKYRDLPVDLEVEGENGEVNVVYPMMPAGMKKRELRLRLGKPVRQDDERELR